MLMTGCGKRLTGCCGGIGRGAGGAGAVGPELPCNTGTVRPFAVLRVISLVAPLLVHSYTHASVDRKLFLVDPGLLVF